MHIGNIMSRVMTLANGTRNMIDFFLIEILRKMLRAAHNEIE